MEELTGLAHFDAMHQAIVAVQTIDEAKDIIDKAEALRIYAKQARMALEDQQRVAEIKLRAERRAGEITGGLDKSEGGRPSENSGQAVQSLSKSSQLESVGINKRTANRWEQIASIPDDDFEGYLSFKKDSEEEITTAGALRLAKELKSTDSTGDSYEFDDDEGVEVAVVFEAPTSTAHVSHNSGQNEWYTPEYIIAAARRVMGSIDLDPATSETANKVVGADRYFTEQDNGLVQEWNGNVWMNPPYAQPLISEFSDKICEQFNVGNVNQAIVLVNNATETRWFQQVAGAASAICFPQGRIKFWHPERESAPLQGQAILYLGDYPGNFTKEFGEMGFVMEVRHEF